MTGTGTSSSTSPIADRIRWTRWELLALAGLTALGLLVRVHDGTSAPLFLDNLDELQFAWAGMGLLLHGDAYTWSYFGAYPTHTTLHLFGESLPMVHDWMDHPPLFSLLVGGWVVLLGDRHLAQVTAAQVRVIPILASTATVFLTALFARPILGRGTALAAAALLATSPAAVLLGREAEPESVQAVLLLGALIATWWLCRGTPHRTRWLVVAGICCFLAPGMKISGLAVGGIVVVILLSQRRLAEFWILLGATVAGILVYPLYGVLTNWHLFEAIVLSQNANRLDVLTIFEFLTAPTGVNRPLHDGWWILGWIGLGAVAVLGGRRRAWFLVWPATGYALVLLVLAGSQQTAHYGWYKVILYPEVYLGAAALGWYAYRRTSVAVWALVLGLGGATATNWLFAGTGGGWAPNPLVLIGLLVLFLAPAVFAGWSAAWQRQARLVFAIAGVILLVANVAESWLLEYLFTGM